MKAQFIYEKFNDETDPIKDIGIGGIVFSEEFQKIYKIRERKLYRKWSKFISQYKNKWIEGEFYYYPKEVYNYERKHAEILLDTYILNTDGIINLETFNGTYCIIPGERYIIKDK